MDNREESIQLVLFIICVISIGGTAVRLIPHAYSIGSRYLTPLVCSVGCRCHTWRCFRGLVHFCYSLLHLRIVLGENTILSLC